MFPESPRSGLIRDAFRALCAVLVTACLGALALTAPASATPLAAAAPAPSYAAKRADIQQQAATITQRPAVLRELRRINKARVRNGLRPVRLNACLTKRVAQPYARSMARSGDFGHQDMSTLTHTCPRFGWAGENIAYGYPNVRSVMEAWLNSDGHRANLLGSQFTHVGLGIKRDANGRRYWVQDFGG